MKRQQTGKKTKKKTEKSTYNSLQIEQNNK